jgi:hypothetical protein
MAVTLNELAKVQTDVLSKAVFEDTLRQNKVLQIATIEDVPGFKVSASRWQTLPASSTRAINGSWTDATGVLEQVAETVHIYGKQTCRFYAQA